jgi:hypothetical protein
MRVLVLSLLAAGLLTGAEGNWSADFDHGGTAGWFVPRPQDWEIADEGGDKVLYLKKSGPVGNPRRPVKFALFQPGCVSDFVAEAKVKRLGRSLLVAFGFQDRLHYYYAHISSDDGSHAVHNGLFKVDGGERFRIGGEGSKPALPTGGWHTVRVVRDVASDRIEVFMDGETAPRFAVVDKSFRYGRVGLGSFDETGYFDDFRLTGTPSEECDETKISPLDP